MSIPNDKLKWIYEFMLKARYFEEKMVEIYTEGKSPVFNIGAGPVPGEMHLAAGQEPASVIMAHLTNVDTVTAPHRPHHHAIAKGVNLKKMAAEIFGKETGLGKGKGGHMHLFDPDVKFSCGGIVGAGLPHAVGAALASKMKKKNSIAVAFIGEGAANSGAFHESMNLAALWHLGIICVIEDNIWGISVPKKSSTSVPTNDLRAAAYGIKGYLVKDNDPLAMYRISEEAVNRARNGEGPSIIEIQTYRFLGHFQGDPELYRDKKEPLEQRKKDPIKKLKHKLIEDKIASDDELKNMETKAHREVDEALQFARDSSYPKREEALDDVFEPVNYL